MKYAFSAPGRTEITGHRHGCVLSIRPEGGIGVE